MIDTVILGAGISGLSAAYHLKQQGKTVLILEPQSHIGGTIRTENKNGFLLEYGPNTALSKPEFEDLIKTLGIDQIAIDGKEHSKERYIADREKMKLIAAPSGLISAITSPLMTLRGKVRVIFEPFISASNKADESLADFSKRRFGVEFSRLIATAMSGIWAADIKLLSTRSGLSTLWELEQEFGGVIKGALKKGFQKRKQPRFKRRLLSFPQGISTLVTALASALPEHTIVCETTVTALTELKNAVRISYRLKDNDFSINASQVIITLPAEQTAQLLTGIDQSYANSVHNVPYSPIGILHLAIKDGSSKIPVKGFGFLCPPEKGKFLMGAIFSSAIFPHRAPTGYHLLTCFVGGGVNPDGANVKNREIRNQALREIESFLQLSEEPTTLDSTYIPKAIPCYPVGHFELEKQTEEFEKTHPHIKIHTNWLKGISLPDRVVFSIW